MTHLFFSGPTCFGILLKHAEKDELTRVGKVNLLNMSLALPGYAHLKLCIHVKSSKLFEPC